MSVLTRLSLDSEHVVNPASGEVVATSAASTEQLVEIREALQTLDAERSAALIVIDAALTARADEAVRRGELESHTFVVGDFRVRVDPPTKRTVDYGELRADLLDRSQRGEIALDDAAIDNAFTPTVRYKLRRRQWNVLAAHVPEIEALLDEYATPARRYVNVGRWRAPAIEGSARDEVES